jgi:hypothetical protein
MKEGAMEYLCLIYEDETLWQKMPKAEMDKLYAEYAAFKDGIKKSGNLIGCNPLEPTHAATTVRVRNGKVLTTDGPFAETKEQLGGYFLIEARDLNDAIQVASRIPGARLGSIEIRPIRQFNPPVVEAMSDEIHVADLR